MSGDFYNQVVKYYQEHPNASSSELLQYLGRKPNAKTMAVVVEVQNSLRGGTPSKRKNRNHSRVPIKTVRYIPPEKK